MKEQVKIKSAVSKTAKSGKSTYYAVELDDGRRGNSFDDLTKYVGQTIDLEVVVNGQFLNFNLPEGGEPEAVAKEYQTEPDNLTDIKIRIAALESAVNAVKILGNVTTADNIVGSANMFVGYIKTGKIKNDG